MHLIKQISFTECPQKCLSGQICNETDNACPNGKCNGSYWGRQCQYRKLNREYSNIFREYYIYFTRTAKCSEI